MDKYEQELYNFLTQEMNFGTMLKVINQFKQVRENLLDEFWNGVYDKLVKSINIKNGNWKVFNPGNKVHSNAKLIIYKDAWIDNGQHPFAGVAWENLFANSYFGVWVNMDSNKVDYAFIDSNLQNMRNINGYKTEKQWWPLWKYGKYDFSNNSELLYILPEKSDPIINDYAELLLTLLPDVEGYIDAMITESMNHST